MGNVPGIENNRNCYISFENSFTDKKKQKKHNLPTPTATGGTVLPMKVKLQPQM